MQHLRSLWLLFALALIAGPSVCLAAPDRPNILFLYSDDHAAHAIGAYGGRLAKLNPTPTLDKLAAEGVMLTNAFCTNSICTPARATIMTGQYSHTNGVIALRDPLPAEKHALPRLMGEAGYQTALIGKWHLKVEPTEFDYYAVLPGQGSYFNPILRVQGDKPWPENIVQRAGYNSFHSSDVITDHTLKWLKDRKKGEPFFLMCQFKAPHDNFENAERYDWLYGDVQIPEPESLRKRGNHGPIGRPLYGTSVGMRTKWRNMGYHMFVDRSLDEDTYIGESYQRYLKKYLRCVRGVDDSIKRIINQLEKSGHLDNTIIVYSSDQGFMLGEHDYIDKRWMYEESLRIPLIVRYPKAYPAGQKIDAIINNTDIAPTLLTMAGIKVPDSMEGRSFVQMLEGKDAPDDWRDATYYRYWLHMAHHDNPAHFGIRTKRYKLIFFYGLKLSTAGTNAKPTEPYWEFYDLEKDPHEMDNRINDPAYAEVIARLRDRLKQMRKELGDTDAKHPEVMQRWEQSLR